MRRLVALFAACAVCLPATALAAAPPGVTYDPDSPAGKEYALPLDAARDRAAGGDGGGGRGVAPAAPLFGAGIRPAAAAAQAETSTPGASKTAGKKPSVPDAEGRSAEGRDGQNRDRGRVLSLEPGSPDAATSRLATGGLIALLVAALGLGGGLAARGIRQS